MDTKDRDSGNLNYCEIFVPVIYLAVVVLSMSNYPRPARSCAISGYHLWLHPSVELYS